MRKRSIDIFMIILTILLVVAELSIGNTCYSQQEVWHLLTQGDTEAVNIVTELRMPRAITALLAGASLSVSGALMQTLFRNPLAGPYVLGVSSGGSLAVAVLVMAGSAVGISRYMIGNWAIALFALAGAFCVMTTIAAVANKVRNSVTLLIIGMMFGSLTGAIISLLQSIAAPDTLKLFINWSLGSLDTVLWEELQLLIPVLLLSLAGSLLLQKPLDALLTSENYAQSMGVNVRTIRMAIILLTSIMAGVTTAFTGPIGFIGTAVPHLVRGLYQTSKHSTVIPGCMLCGANLLMLCDLVAHLGSQVPPINALCALVGAPVIITIALKHK